jgi:hypothetical protein
MRNSAVPAFALVTCSAPEAPLFSKSMGASEIFRNFGQLEFAGNQQQLQLQRHIWITFLCQLLACLVPRSHLPCNIV